ncbi:MAG: hypothetical protein AMXMBFR42_08000 [Burkholderiales bacterium]
MSTTHPAALLADDTAARAEALDVRRSFVVQAPAGSGKTELLIQRLLALLAVARRPEAVLAITFTRKAAGEMRERVVRALVAAGDSAEGAKDETALEPHERTTRALARAVLARDAELGWNLIHHPSRLAIQTIDALVQAIARQSPLESDLPPATRFTEEPKERYRAAAHAAIAAASATDERWRLLLDHQDNDADALASRIVDLLERREEWRTLVAAGPGRVRDVLEATLAREVGGELDTLRAIIGAAPFARVSDIAAACEPHLDADDADLRDALLACVERGVPPLDMANLAWWQEIAGWLCTKDGSGMRKSASRMRGVPVIGKGEGADTRRARARAVEAWLEALRETPGLADAIPAIAALPPVRYGDEAWSRIEAMLSLLPELAAHLEVEFARAREVDFPKATLSALAALGERDAPGDALLRLDLRVDHLLVDEFQDTSYAHLDLIGRLVAGWSPGDGRTLFAVGDPMQSIYRFRGAEVRAFVEAMAAGTIEGVAVERLTLRRNFRSQAGLVSWVNRQFPSVLGAIDEPWQGRVAFAESIATKPAEEGAAVTVDIAADDAAEAEVVLARVREARARGGSIAILARNRGHLGALLPALRDAGIAYSAVDLDVLADRPAVRDMVALAHALLQPDDRLAWLAVLRGPSCGLTLADLHLIVQAADATAGRSIEAALDVPPEGLSTDARARIAHVVRALAAARNRHGLAPLVERVREAWIAIGGPATLSEALDLVAVDDVLALLAAHQRAGDLPDWNAFIAHLAETRLSPPPGDDDRVQVMTMHKAKGLEFDTVILPGLARGKTRNDTPFLRWRTRRHGLMLGLARSRGGDDDGVYAYLARLAAGEGEAELARLAYVACTRARRRLALVAVLGVDAETGGWERPSRASFLGRFDATIVHEAPPPTPGAVDAGPPATARPAPFERLPSLWRAHAAVAPLMRTSSARTVETALPFDWARERARRLGVVVHQVLARVAVEGLSRFDAARLASERARLETVLIAEGALPGEAAAEASEALATVATTLADPRGRWLFDPAHEDSRSEWALTGIDEGEIVHVVLDRAFIAKGERWIVDFKTGTHEGADAAEFLDAELARYRGQLERYGRIVATLDPAHRVRLALYHPRVPGGWREVTT